MNDTPGRSNKRQRTSKNSNTTGSSTGTGMRGDDTSSLGGNSSYSTGNPRNKLYLNMDMLYPPTTGTSEDPGSLLLGLSGQYSRPRAYSDSLMALSPSLLGNGRSNNYFTFRTNYPTSDSTTVISGTSTAGAGGVSSILSSLPPEEINSLNLHKQSYLHSNKEILNTGDKNLYTSSPSDHLSSTRSSKLSKSKAASLKSTAFIDAKAHYTTKYVQRHSAKIATRPNLVDWKQQLDATLITDALFERQAARIFDETHCDVCSVDKWPNAKFCWNENCPISPVYYKLTGVERVIDAATVGKQQNNLPNVVEPDHESLFEPPHTAIGSRSQAPLPNKVNAYLLGLPSRLIGSPTMRATNTEAFSTHIDLPPRSLGLGTTGLIRSDGNLMNMVCRKVSPDHRTTTGTTRGSGDKHTATPAAPATVGIALNTSEADLFNTTSVTETTDNNHSSSAYTQYYHTKGNPRSDSFAGGETDTEVPGSPSTLA